MRTDSLMISGCGEASDSLPATRHAEKRELGNVGGNGPQVGQEMTVGGWGLGRLRYLRSRTG